MLGFIGKDFSLWFQMWDPHSNLLGPEYLGTGDERFNIRVFKLELYKKYINKPTPTGSKQPVSEL